MKRIAKSDFVVETAAAHQQVGAVCWRMHKGKVEVLLVTSRDTGRWIIPKGWPIKGLTDAQSAAREAWEEAGVEGAVSDAGIGSYSYDKRRLPKPPLPCKVTVFPLRVGRLADKFPEKNERQRKWFSARKAAKKVDEPQLRDLLAQLQDMSDRETAPTTDPDTGLS